MSYLDDRLAEREQSDIVLTGSTARVRQLSAQLLVKVDRIEGKSTEQWIVDVAEGRIPA